MRKKFGINPRQQLFMVTDLKTKKTYILEPRRKGSRKLSSTVMPAIGPYGDVKIEYRRVPLYVRKAARRVHPAKNPKKTVTKIYEKVLRIEAQKGPGHKCDAACKRAKHRYYHVFTTKPKMFGLRDGTIWIKS